MSGFFKGLRLSALGTKDSLRQQDNTLPPLIVLNPRSYFLVFFSDLLGGVGVQGPEFTPVSAEPETLRIKL